MPRSPQAFDRQEPSLRCFAWGIEAKENQTGIGGASPCAQAAISTALAYVLYFRILATAGATNLLLVTFLIPVSAILLGTLILGEVLLPRHVVGMALIGLGLAAIDGRPLKVARAMISRRRRAA